MSKVSAWILIQDDRGFYGLIAPNGERLFNVSLPTPGMLGRMFMDEVEAAEEPEVLLEYLHERP